MKSQKTNSFFLTGVQSKPYTRSTASIEVENRSDLIKNLLEEFENSSEEEKIKFKLLLSEWLDKLDEEEIYTEDQAKVRDFIYEMF
jgi:hypothetical protein